MTTSKIIDKALNCMSCMGLGVGVLVIAWLVFLKLSGNSVG